jgi:putative NADPH-quinone reductase
VTRRVLIVFAHPDEASYSAALRDLVLRVAEGRRAEVRLHDLYATWRGAAPESKPHLAPYFDDVAWCDTLVFVYPTWWSGQPAVLKGWVDRVLANGVAWTLEESSGHAMPALRNVTRIVAITTHGRSRTVNLMCGRAGRATIMRSVRRLCSWRCRARWVALYSLDRSTRFERDRFMQRVERLLRRIL